MTVPEELLEVVTKEGKIIGILPRSEIHGDPSKLHRVVHILVFNTKGELLLQKRSMNKDVAPEKWDTSVGGHVNPGEELFDAVRREMNEEPVLRPANQNFSIPISTQTLMRANLSIPIHVYMMGRYHLIEMK